MQLIVQLIPSKCVCLMEIKIDWQGEVIGKRWGGKLSTILSSIQTKCPVHNRLACIQLRIAFFVLCDSRVKRLRIVKKVNSQRRLHLSYDFSFSFFLCCHPEIIRKLESKLLHSVSYQGLQDLPCAAFWVTNHWVSVLLAQRIFPLAKMQFPSLPTPTLRALLPASAVVFRS